MTTFLIDLSPDDIHALWRNITCPVLLVAGSESWTRSGSEPTELVAEFTDARHVVVERAGHWVQHDQLDVFLDLGLDAAWFAQPEHVTFPTEDGGTGIAEGRLLARPDTTTCVGCAGGR